MNWSTARREVLTRFSTSIGRARTAMGILVLSSIIAMFDDYCTKAREREAVVIGA
jgi:hypothetical protein